MNATIIHYVASGILAEAGVSDDLSMETQQIVAAIKDELRDVEFRSSQESTGVAIDIFVAICDDIFGNLEDIPDVYGAAVAAIKNNNFVDQAHLVSRGLLK